jgi:type IV pilus assembly protein PilQ
MRTTIALLTLLAGAPISLAGEPGQGGETQKRYTGQKVDLDFNQGDVRNILRLLANVGQKKLVIDDKVAARVTLKLHDTPWDEALDAVAREAKVVAKIDGDTIRVSSAR